VNNIAKFKLKDEYLNPLLNLILIWLFSYSLTSAIVSLTILRTDTLHILLYSGLFTVMSAVIFYNEYTMAAAGSVLVVIGLYVNWIFTRDTISFEWLLFLSHVHGTWLFITGMGSYSSAFNITTVNGLIFIVTCITGLMMNIKGSYPFLFALGASFFITANMVSPEGCHPAFFIMLAVLFVSFIRTSKPDAKAVIKIIPICVAALALSWVIPMPQTNLIQRTLEEAYEDIYWFLREPFRPKYFSANTMGFESADGMLGGNMPVNNEFIMYVFADEPTYLTGATKDIYTGSSWQSSHADEEYAPAENMEQYDLSAVMTNLLANSGTSYILNSYGISKKHLSINIGKSRTGTIFQPALSTNLDMYNGYNVLRRDQDLRSDPLLKKDAVYSIDYYDVDYENDYLQSMLEASYRGYYSDSAHALVTEAVESETLPQNRRAILWEIAQYYIGMQAPHAEFNYENYLQLPDSLPGRVFELVHDLTMESRSDYEKITAIQNYLHGFTYNLKPGTVPKDRDFVDYFLFERKEGYCTYFATSMAVMARIAGLPSRYKEGYIIPENKTNDEYYTVYGTNAHAWAEVYFEGVGWVPIEATPASYFRANYPSLAEDTNYNDYYDEENPDDFGLNEGFIGSGSADGEIEGDGTITGISQGSENKTEVKPVTILLVSAFSGLVCYMFFRKVQEDKRHKTMRSNDGRQASIEAYKGIIDLLSFYGLPKENHESAMVYAERVGRYSPIGSMTSATTARIFSKARYSEENISEGEASVVSQAYFSMYRNLCSSNYRYKFFIHRYIKKLYA